MSKMFLIILFVLGVFGGSNSSNITSRIIGGSPMSTTSHPHVVSVQNINLQHLCGGSIINTKWVLSSASCALTPGIKYISAGSIDLTHYEYSLHILKIFSHEHFNSIDDLNNIALIKTLQSFEFALNVRAIGLPIYNIGTEQIMEIAGWGITSKTVNTFSKVLKYLTVTSMSKDECRDDLGFQREIYDSQLCGFRSNGNGVCTGDTGAGVVFSGSIHGIVGKTLERQSCALGYPEVFTRVYPLMSWIDQIVESN